MNAQPTKHISVAINRTTDEVYKFTSNPANLSQWASGIDDLGEIKIKFAEKNTYGVMDHYVTLPSGEIFYNPMRVIKNANGCEVIFTLFRSPQMSDEMFNKDAETIKKDLLKLKSVLEK